MSFWDRYLAPGDVRNEQQILDGQHVKAKEQALSEAITPKKIERAPRLDAATRDRRQNGLLVGGIVFAALSVLITRRAVARKIVKASALPSAPGVPPKVASGLDAAEALGLATLNVFSFGLVGMGAAAKFFDVADIEDLRDKVRKGVGFDVYGGDDAADKELEAWVADVLSRKDGGGLKEGLAGRLAELEKIAKDKPWEQTKK